MTPAIAAQAPPKGSGTIEITGPMRVIDGDTFEVYIDGRQTAIGIIGIKALRANTPCGRRAAQFTADLVNCVDGRRGANQAALRRGRRRRRSMPASDACTT